MSLLLGLALLVVEPSFASHCDVAVLPFLCSAAEKDDERISVFAKVHAIPRSEIDAVLEHASPDAFYVREVSQLQPAQRRRHFRRCCGIEPLKASREGTRSCSVEILENRQRTMVTQSLPLPSTGPPRHVRPESTRLSCTPTATAAQRNRCK